MDRKWLIILVVIFLAVTSGISSAVDLGIITGDKQGTYFQFGLDMMKVVKQYGLDLEVYNSRGSVENIYAVYKRPDIHMGIVQSDVLAFVMKVRNNATLRRIASKVKMVFPLYNEEVHLLGRKGIQSFENLKGKIVAIGKEGSGTYMTSKLLFEVSGITPKKLLPLGTEKALSKLKQGQVDAMFYVAGFPVRLFSENVSSGENLHLISITTKSIRQFYPGAIIPANTYSWQTETVNTVAVRAVLISFDFRRNNCDHVGRFAGLIYDNLNFLKQHGHPKWKSVNLDYKLKGWDQYDCVKKCIQTHLERERSMGKNPVFDAIKKML